MYFLVDFYFLSSVFLFCFPCMVGTSTGTACDGSWGNGGWEGTGFGLGQHKWTRRYFCPLMDCDIDRGGIMSNRYSRCRSARLGALCPPMPVFKYAMLTPRPRRQKWGAGIQRGSAACFCTRLGLQGWRWEETPGAAASCLHLSGFTAALSFSESSLPIWNHGINFDPIRNNEHGVLRVQESQRKPWREK